MAFNLNLTFGPRWENVSNIRSFVSEMLSTGIMDINDAKKVATASSELVENVVKYSALGGAVIDIKKDPGLGKITLTLKNISNQKNIDTFKTIFKEVTNGDAKEIYKAMMLKSLKDSQNSQLGLARIRYECQGEIAYELSDDLQSVDSGANNENINEDLKLLSVTVEIPVKLCK